MNIANIKLTQNQQLIVNALLSMLASAFVAAAQSGYQYLTQHGNINLAQAFLVFIGVLWGTFSIALAAYIPSHVQQELDAWKDTAMLAQSELARIEGKQAEPAPAQPLVVIHTTGASVAPTSANSVPAVQIPQRPVAPSAPKPVQLQSVESVQPAAPQQIAFMTTGGSTVAVPMPQATDDVLGDLPASTGQPMDIKQITGVVPVYGASGK
jgi:hypothetical protein